MRLRSYRDGIMSNRASLTHDLVARFAASRTMSRADYSALSPAVILNNLDLTGTGGNADLKPVRSNNYDLGLECTSRGSRCCRWRCFTWTCPRT